MNFYCTVSISTKCICARTLYNNNIVAFTHTRSHKATNYSEWRCHVCLYSFLAFVLYTFSVWGHSPRARPTVWRRRQWVDCVRSCWFIHACIYTYVHLCMCMYVCVCGVVLVRKEQRMFLPGSMTSVYQIANEQKRASNYRYMYILPAPHTHSCT